MAVRRNYRINLRNYGNPPAIMVSQYDENYDLVFEVYDGVVPATGLNAYTVKLVGRQPGNDPALKYEFTGTVSGIANNILSFTIDTTMTGRAGKGTAEIVILDTTNDVKFASFNLPVYVEKAAVPDDAIDADVERAQEIADEVQEIVDTAAAEVKGEAESWAVGERDGEPVSSDDPTYQNNAKFYAEQAAQIAEDISGVTEQVATNTSDISDLKEELNQVEKTQEFSVPQGAWKQYTFDINVGDVVLIEATQATQNINYGFRDTEDGASFGTGAFSPTEQFNIYTCQTASHFIRFYSNAIATVRVKIISYGFELVKKQADTIKNKVELRTIETWYNKSATLSGGTATIGDSTTRLLNIASVNQNNDLSNGYTVKISLLDSNYQYACSLATVKDATKINILGTWTYLSADSTVSVTQDCFIVVMVRKSNNGDISPSDASKAIKVEIISSSANYIKQFLSHSKWTGKKVAFVGDSITYGVNTTDGNIYYQLLNDMIGFSNVYADGVAGSCYSSTSNYGTSITPIVNRWSNIPTDRDLIAIFAGTNDWGHNTPIGSIADTTDISLYGALYITLSGILEANPDARLVLFTPLHRWGFGDYQEDTSNNGQGHPLKDYVDAIKASAEMFGVPVIDLFSTACLNPRIAAIKTNYVPDGLHPNSAGHHLLAERIAPLFETL